MPTWKVQRSRLNFNKSHKLILVKNIWWTNKCFDIFWKYKWQSLCCTTPEIFYALELVLAIDDQKGPDSNYYPCRTKHTEPSIHPFSVALIQEWERKVTECWKRWDWKHRPWLDSCDVRLNYFKWLTNFHLEENIVLAIAHSIFY